VAGTAEYVQALKDIVIVLMIEKGPAVESLDAILAVPGIDMIQWGPADYAMSIGRPGDWHHPDVRAVERHVIERSLAAGIPPRIEINDAADAEPYLAMGVRHFCLGTDMVILHEWWRRQGAALRKLVSLPQTPGSIR
jgi:4-hydroxy-2-oxoheptanedioate aldolase